MEEQQAAQEEALFINCCVFTKKTYIEIYKKSVSWPQKIFLSLIVLCFMPLFLLATTMTSELPIISRLITLATSALILYRWIAAPYIYAKRAMRQDDALFHELTQSKLTFYEDRFLSCGNVSNSEITVYYTQIIKRISSKNLYLLKIKPNIYFILDKTNFLKGNLDEFDLFIRRKAVNAKNWL